jgi:hypothetical protein
MLCATGFEESLRRRIRGLPHVGADDIQILGDVRAHLVANILDV